VSRENLKKVKSKKGKGKKCDFDADSADFTEIFDRITGL
jgi:hypothetical protein